MVFCKSSSLVICNNASKDENNSYSHFSIRTLFLSRYVRLPYITHCKTKGGFANFNPNNYVVKPKAYLGKAESGA